MQRSLSAVAPGNIREVPLNSPPRDGRASRSDPPLSGTELEAKGGYACATAFGLKHEILFQHVFVKEDMRVSS